MFDFVKKLMFARQLKMEKGELIILGNPVAVLPIPVFAYLQKVFINELGYEKARRRIYLGSKLGAMLFNTNLRERFKFKGKDLLQYQFNIVMWAGWGVWELVKWDDKTYKGVARIRKSPIAKYFPNYNKPVDFYAAGFSAGGLSTVLKKDIDVIETKCIAMGKPFCELIMRPASKISAEEQKWLKEIFEEKRIKEILAALE